jgi:hypothetical protein
LGLLPINISKGSSLDVSWWWDDTSLNEGSQLVYDRHSNAAELRNPPPRMRVGLSRSDFSLAIKLNGKPPNLWRWEIHCPGRSGAVEKSSTCFETMTAARKAGKEALKLFLNSFYP